MNDQLRTLARLVITNLLASVATHLDVDSEIAAYGVPYVADLVIGRVTRWWTRKRR